MNDLIKLAEKHGIENRLYHGEGLNIIYSVLGEGRLHRWFTCIADEDFEKALTKIVATLYCFFGHYHIETMTCIPRVPYINSEYCESCGI